jgi:ABC-type transport system involved in cytochrome bd biosynthesis fused ATPase/permease subunit
MAEQNYANHTQIVPLFHRVLIPVIALTLIGACINLFLSFGDHQRLYSASLIVVLTVCLAVLSILSRVFALKAQDRAIRADENLRHFALTGKLLDPRLGVKQVVALRFAPDEEFVALTRKAVDQSLTPDAIKRAVKQWRADTYRV